MRARAMIPLRAAAVMSSIELSISRYFYDGDNGATYYKLPAGWSPPPRRVFLRLYAGAIPSRASDDAVTPSHDTLRRRHGGARRQLLVAAYTPDAAWLAFH